MHTEYQIENVCELVMISLSSSFCKRIRLLLRVRWLKHWQHIVQLQMGIFMQEPIEKFLSISILHWSIWWACCLEVLPVTWQSVGQIRHISQILLFSVVGGIGETMTY